MQYCLTLDVKIICGGKKEEKILKGKGVERWQEEKLWRNKISEQLHCCRPRSCWWWSEMPVHGPEQTVIDKLKMAALLVIPLSSKLWCERIYFLRRKPWVSTNTVFWSSFSKCQKCLLTWTLKVLQIVWHLWEEGDLILPTPQRQKIRIKESFIKRNENKQTQKQEKESGQKLFFSVSQW